MFIEALKSSSIGIRLVGALFPLATLYLLLAYILGDWNIVLFSKGEKILIIFAIIINIIIGNTQKISLKELTKMYLFIIISGLCLYFFTAFYAGEWSTMSLSTGERAFPAVILEIITLILYQVHKEQQMKA